MSRRARCCLVILGLALAPAAFAGNLARLLPPGEITLGAAPGGKLLVRQTSAVELAAGVNDITFMLPLEGVTATQVHLRLPETGVRLLATEAATDKPLWLRWRVEAEAAVTCPLVVTYPATGLTWELTYVFSRAEAGWDCAAWVRLLNTSGKDWGQVRVLGLPCATPEVSLPLAADLRTPLFRCEGLLADAEVRWDPARYGDQPVQVLRVSRVPGGPQPEFATAALPAGKVEVVRTGVGAPTAVDFTGALPYTPRWKNLEVNLGPLAGVTANRKQIATRQVAVRSDAGDRMALYDLEEEYELNVDNRRAEPVTVRVFEKITETWEMVRSTVPWRPEDAHLVSFEVPLQGQQGLRVVYLVRKKNLEP